MSASSGGGSPVQATQGARARLPQRRRHELLDFEHDGHCYTAGLGYFSDGSLAEIFINIPGRAGTGIETVARDAAILASISLQYGAPVETIRRAITRNSDGTASGPLGAVLDLISDTNPNDRS